MSEDIITAQLPTGLYDEKGQPTTLPIEFAFPNRKLNNLAFELSKPAEARGDDALFEEAFQNMVRVCMRKIGGKKVDYAELMGRDLDEHLDPKQITLIVAAITDLTTAKSGAVELAYRSVQFTYNPEEKEHRRILNLPTGELDEERVPITREVEIVAPSRNLIANAQQRAQVFKGRGKLIVDSEADLNTIRLSLRRIEDREFKFADLRGDLVDEVLTQLEQSCLKQVMLRLGQPDQSETADFLATLGGGGMTRVNGTRSLPPTSGMLTGED